MSIFLVLLVSTLSLAAPLILAACGGFLSERSGVINIALEGNMLASAVMTAVVSFALHSALLGLAAGVLASIVMSLIHWLLTQLFCIDHVVSGMAINLFALGASNFINQKSTSITSLGSMPKLPRLEFLLGGQHIYLSCYLILAYLLPIALAHWSVRTRGGLRLIAVGNDPAKSRLAGLKPKWIRLYAQLGTGVLAGLSGAMIADSAGRFTDNMTSGRGYIALAALILGGWKPIPTFVACLVFGLFESLQIALQGVAIGGVSFPVELWQSAPYLLTIVALAGMIKKTTPPYGLGKP